MSSTNPADIASQIYSDVDQAGSLLTGLQERDSSRVDEINSYLNKATAGATKLEHAVRELQTQLVTLKAIKSEEAKICKRQIELQQMLIAEQGTKLKDFKYWMEKIRSECGLVEGEEFSRIIGFYKNQRTSQDKENEEAIADVKVCFTALKKHGNSVHVMRALAVALKMESS